MRLGLIAAATAAALSASCTQTPVSADPDADARYTFWRPAPVADAPDPTATVNAAPASAWRAIDPENLLIMDLADGGRVAIELAPDFAPVHVANIRALAKGGWWSGAAIYRELSGTGGSCKVSASGFDAMNGALTAM